MRSPRLYELEEKYMAVAGTMSEEPDFEEKVRELETLLNEILHDYKKHGREI